MRPIRTIFLPTALLLMASLPFLSTSCTKDEPDLRDEIIGKYDYTVKIYVDNGTDLVYYGDQGSVGDITGTMRVIKSTSETGVLDFYDGNVLMFSGINVTDAGNAIVFDIPVQEAWIGPGIFEVTGYDYWNVGSTAFHGAFLRSDDSVEVAFSARVMDIESGLVMVLTAFRK
jgi:hypothetical protein